jgi:hypothetical protein
VCLTELRIDMCDFRIDDDQALAFIRACPPGLRALSFTTPPLVSWPLFLETILRWPERGVVPFALDIGSIARIAVPVDERRSNAHNPRVTAIMVSGVVSSAEVVIFADVLLAHLPNLYTLRVHSHHWVPAAVKSMRLVQAMIRSVRMVGTIIVKCSGEV